MQRGSEMDNRIPVVAVVGPTASGKTGLAVQLCLRFGGEVVSADSMQVYRGLDVGTAKATKQEQQGVPHHLLDILEPGEDFSVARFVELAGRAIREIDARGKLPVVAGGTGLYVDSLLENIQFSPQPEDQALRRRLAEEGRGDPEGLWRRLAQVDPDAAKGLHPNNVGRVARALELNIATGKTMEEQRRESRRQPSPYRSCCIGLDFRDRELLYRRVEQRVDRMLREGLLEEARALLESGTQGTAVQAIGYKELFPFLRGEATLEECAARLKQETRRYAKRQLTWFRRSARIHWLYWEDYREPEELWDAASCLARDWMENGEA